MVDAVASLASEIIPLPPNNKLEKLSAITQTNSPGKTHIISMTQYSEDIYTEPSNVDVDTLGNLGPLRGMAGIWQGTRGLDVKPKAEGPKKQAYVERMELQPIDPVTNGPQLLYGLRYYTHITKPDQVKTYHEQVGYWLWEPATSTVIHTLTIPRGQT